MSGLAFVYILFDVCTYTFYKLPLYQTLYMILWVAFLFNFYILYTSNTTIYITMDYTCSRLKICGFLFLITILTFCYSYNIHSFTA